MTELEDKEAELKKLEEVKVEPNSVMDEAKQVNITRSELLDREEKLQDRKEKLHAEQMVAGKGTLEASGKEETDKVYAEKILAGE